LVSHFLERSPESRQTYGGTASGVFTAYSAAKEGLHVVLLEAGEHVGGMVTGGLSATDLGDFSIIGGYVRSLTWLIRHQQFACQMFRNLSTKFFLCTARRLQDSCCSIPDTVDRLQTGDATLRLNEYIDLLSTIDALLVRRTVKAIAKFG
jgi:glycine/D-amino acid oxidase-like deaminating enzyme